MLDCQVNVVFHINCHNITNEESWQEHSQILLFCHYPICVRCWCQSIKSPATKWEDQERHSQPRAGPARGRQNCWDSAWFYHHSPILTYITAYGHPIPSLFTYCFSNTTSPIPFSVVPLKFTSYLTWSLPFQGSMPELRTNGVYPHCNVLSYAARLFFSFGWVQHGIRLLVTTVYVSFWGKQIMLWRSSRSLKK